MKRTAGAFVAGLVAGVALCVAPASFVLVSLTGRDGVVWWAFYAIESFAAPWRLLF